MTSDIVDFWCVGFTKPGAEKKADESLRRENYATLLLLDRVRQSRPWPGRRGQYKIEWLDIPRYKRYVFVGVRPEQGLYAANEADGICTILHRAGIPLVVPHKVIDALMKKADADGIVTCTDATLRKPFEEGQKVRIKTEHPLIGGLVAKILRDTGEAGRLWVEGLGPLGKAEVDPAFIETV
jgi:hypothetical protein